MPLYEYRCRDCGRDFEALVASFRADASCPGCSSTSVERQLSTFAMAGGASPASPTAQRPSVGGCCGGGCGCAHR